MQVLTVVSENEPMGFWIVFCFCCPHHHHQMNKMVLGHEYCQFSALKDVKYEDTQGKNSYKLLFEQIRLPPPLVSNHLSSATTFPKCQKFLIQITIFATSRKQPDHLSRKWPRSLLELKI